MSHTTCKHLFSKVSKHLSMELDLAPVGAFKAPDFIRELEARGLISEQRATIEFNPIAFKAMASIVTFGPLENNMAADNIWHSHEL